MTAFLDLASRGSFNELDELDEEEEEEEEDAAARRGRFAAGVVVVASDLS